MQTLKKGSKKLLNAWAFYDWANSVYSLVIASSAQVASTEIVRATSVKSTPSTASRTVYLI